MRIPLSNNQWAIIDDDDWDDVSAYTWGVSWQGKYKQKQYVQGRHTADRHNHNNIKLHRLIMNLGKGDKRVVHHINGNTFDNRKCNLMICQSTSVHSKIPRTYKNR